MTQDLLVCKDWLEKEGCTQVARKSTGVYWKPVFHILEGSMMVILANARNLKNVPERLPLIYNRQFYPTCEIESPGL
jgi:transposase